MNIYAFDLKGNKQTKQIVLAYKTAIYLQNT